MEGGEVFVPKIPSMRVIDLAKSIAPDAEIEVIGIRPGEKLHEILVSEDDARHTIELEDMYVVEPSGVLWFGHGWKERGASLPEGFVYASDTNEQWLSLEELDDILEPFENSEKHQLGKV
jgi:UDP-N-acetylglucosamine 4,6-dehydratase